MARKKDLCLFCDHHRKKHLNGWANCTKCSCERFQETNIYNEKRAVTKK